MSDIGELTDRALELLNETMLRLERRLDSETDDLLDTSRATGDLIKITRAIAELSKERRGQRRDQIEADETMTFDDKQKVVFEFAKMLPIEQKISLVRDIRDSLSPMERKTFEKEGLA